MSAMPGTPPKRCSHHVPVEMCSCSPTEAVLLIHQTAAAAAEAAAGAAAGSCHRSWLKLQLQHGCLEQSASRWSPQPQVVACHRPALHCRALILKPIPSCLLRVTSCPFWKACDTNGFHTQRMDLCLQECQCLSLSAIALDCTYPLGDPDTDFKCHGL